MSLERKSHPCLTIFKVKQNLGADKFNKFSPHHPSTVEPSITALVASSQDCPFRTTVLWWPYPKEACRLTHIATGSTVVPSACDSIEWLLATHAHGYQLVSHPLWSPLAQLLRLAVLKEREQESRNPCDDPHGKEVITATNRRLHDKCFWLLSRHHQQKHSRITYFLYVPPFPLSSPPFITLFLVLLICCSSFLQNYRFYQFQKI